MSSFTSILLTLSLLFIKVKNLLDLVKGQSKSMAFPVKDTAEDQPLPPASFQRFLKVRNITGVVFTDHEKEFTNK